MLPRNPDVDRDGIRGVPDSAEDPELSCSAEGLVTPLLGTQSRFVTGFPSAEQIGSCRKRRSR